MSISADRFVHTLLAVPEGPRAWKPGDRVDVLDDSTNIFCPAHIIHREKNGYKVRWLGWEPSDDSVVENVLIHPPETYVFKSKAWVKLPKKLGWWPCVAYIRFPKENDDFGLKNLSYTTLMYVEVVAPVEFQSQSMNRFKKGFWARVWDIVPFAEGAGRKRAKGLTLKTQSTDFQKCLELIDNDLTTPALNFVLDNSLCVELDATKGGQGKAGDRSNHGVEQEDTHAKGGKGNDDIENDNSIGKKRKKSVVEPEAPPMEDKSFRTVKRDFEAIRSRKLDLSWNIQDHFEPYFTSLEQKWHQRHVELAGTR